MPEEAFSQESNFTADQIQFPGEEQTQEGAPANEAPEQPVEQPSVQDGVQDGSTEQPAGESADTGSGEEGDAGGNPEDTPEEPSDDEKIFTRLSELSNGAVKSIDDITSLVEKSQTTAARLQELENQVKEGVKPKFPNEKAEWIYNYLTQDNQIQDYKKVEGLFRTLSLDTTKLEPKDLLFEQFLLDPKNAHLSADKAKRIFDKQYERKYGKMKYEEENEYGEKIPVVDEELEYEHELAVREAKERIEKLQGEFKNAKSETPEQQNNEQVLQQIRSSVEKAVGEFNGLSYDFSIEDDGQSLKFDMKFPLDEKEREQVLKEHIEDASNPNQWLQKKLNDFVDKQGQLDFEAWTDWLYEVKNLDKIVTEAFKQGFHSNKETMLKKLKNQQGIKSHQEKPDNKAKTVAEQILEQIPDNW